MASRKITDCVPELQKAWPILKKAYDSLHEGYYLKITCTHRPPEEQFELFQKGRKFDINGKVYQIDRTKIVTNVDGTKVMSAHNYYPARAFDVAVMNAKTKKATWDEELYHPLPDLCKTHKLENGGLWKSLKDWPHCQIRDYQNYGRKVKTTEKGLFDFILAIFLG